MAICAVSVGLGKGFQAVRWASVACKNLSVSLESSIRPLLSSSPNLPPIDRFLLVGVNQAIRSRTLTGCFCSVLLCPSVREQGPENWGPGASLLKPGSCLCLTHCRGYPVSFRAGHTLLLPAKPQMGSYCAGNAQEFTLDPVLGLHWRLLTLKGVVARDEWEAQGKGLRKLEFQALVLSLICKTELDGLEPSRCVREAVAFVSKGAKYPRTKINQKEIIVVHHWVSVRRLSENWPFHLGLTYSNLLNTFGVKYCGKSDFTERGIILSVSIISVKYSESISRIFSRLYT